MFESPGYFYEGPLLVHEYCMYLKWFLTGFHFSGSFIPEDFIWYYNDFLIFQCFDFSLFSLLISCIDLICHVVII